MILFSYNSYIHYPIYYDMINEPHLLYKIKDRIRDAFKLTDDFELSSKLFNYIKTFVIPFINEKEILLDESGIYSVFRRKYYGRNSCNHGMKYYYKTNDMVLFFSKNSDAYIVDFIVNEKDYLDLLQNMHAGNICYLVTKHSVEQAKRRALGQLKNCINKKCGRVEDNIRDYINKSNSIFKVELKKQFKIVNMLNNGFEDSDYYTDNKMVYVLANNVLITCYAYSPDKYDSIDQY